MALATGCGRGRAVVEDGEWHAHPQGFGVMVPEGWAVFPNDDGVRLVDGTLEAGGYPTIRIEVIPSSELPQDFLKGHRYRWSGGQASFSYRRWSNALGTGFALTVYLRSSRHCYRVESEVWSDGVRVDRRFFRKRIWPVVNSIAEGS